MKKYFNRIIEKEIKHKLSIFGALHIVGVKGCGKTTTAEKMTSSSISLSDYANKDLLRILFDSNPDKFMDGKKPRLIDEWQDIPEIWDIVRCKCDKLDGFGHYILTGSSSKKIKTSHTGTGRISTIKMYPMSLYESGESNGSISLKDLFDNKFKVANSNLSLKDIIFLCCRGGWPKVLEAKDQESQLEISHDYFNQIFNYDMFNIDKRNRKSSTMKLILKSYARNISTLAKDSTMYNDVDIDIRTFNDYLDILKRLNIVQEIEPWNTSIRSKISIRSGTKRQFVDPSIACAALNATPDKLLNDLHTFGFIFETLCIRDLRVYASRLGGEIYYYRDKLNLECDCVLTLNDGRYAAIEIKLYSPKLIEEAAKNLNKFDEIIDRYNKSLKEDKKSISKKINKPDIKIILTNFELAYQRKEDGIYIIPIGCLKD